VIRQNESFERIVEALKRAARALREADVPFLLGGGLACWARGGPRTDHDVDFLVRPVHAEAGLAALENAGLQGERPAEHWLFKAYDNGVLIDLIFEPSGFTVDDGMFERAAELDVAAVRMNVASLEDVLATKLLALNEQHLDYRAVLEVARTLREQIDWEWVRAATRHSPFAHAFFTLLADLRIVDDPQPASFPLAGEGTQHA
jgi:predicted nucleotidyltransferase